MTLPNKLTIARIITVPFVFFTWYVAFHLNLYSQYGIVLIWIFFAFSEITDILDGYIARSRGLVSDVGKLLDPFADIFLRVTYFLCFLSSGLMPLWAFVVILWRELSIMFLRTLLIREGTAMAANAGGKLKAVLYFISGVGGFFVLTLWSWFPETPWLNTAEQIIEQLFNTAALASLLSLIGYLINYRKRS